MSILMTAILVSVGALALGLALFWTYWVVRISVNETRKATGRFRRVLIDGKQQAEPTS